MKNKELRLVLLSALMAQGITKEMLRDYLEETFDEDKEGIPADYFYAFMQSKINNSIQIAKDLLDVEEEVVKKTIGSQVDMYV